MKNRETIRCAVDLYYVIQELRKDAENKRRAVSQQQDTADLSIIDEAYHDLEVIEDEKIKPKLNELAEAEPLGRWCLSINGLSGVLTCGLMAELLLDPWCCRVPDAKVRRCTPFDPHTDFGCGRIEIRNVSCWHRFAGLDGERKRWAKGERRPYNARLHTLMWKIGDQFRRNAVSSRLVNLTDEELAEEIAEKYQRNGKGSNGTLLTAKTLAEAVAKKRKAMERKETRVNYEPGRIYSRIYAQAKQRETERNESGDLAEQAFAKMAAAKESGAWSKLPAGMRKAWSSGKLQLAGVDLRAMRVAEKLFLSHYFHVAYVLHYGEEPAPPYAMTKMGGSHADYIPPPNLHVVADELKKAKRKARV